jgi:hypothetical protein
MFPFARPTGPIAGRLSRLIEMNRIHADRGTANWLRGLGADLAAMDPDDARALVRGMRADGQLAIDYFTTLLHADTQRLRAPVISVAGERDTSTEYYQERYREWDFLSDTVALVVLAEAGHFFTRHRAPELAQIITRTHVALRDNSIGTLPCPGGAATWWLEDHTTRVPEPASAVADSQSGHNHNDHASSPGQHGATAPKPSMKRFLIIALSQLISVTGSTLTQFALPLWIYLQTGSLARFGLIAVAGLIPGIVISPLAGAVVDRSDRRKVMIAGDLASAVTIGIMLALVSAGQLGIWQIYLLIGCLSVSLAFQRTAYLSAVPQVVPKRYLGNANGVILAAGGVAQFIAPLAGVGLLAVIGLRGILVFDVVSYAVAIVTAVLVRFPAAMAFKRAETITAEIRFGFRYVMDHRSFLALVLFSAAINFFLAPLLVLISPLVLSF